VCFLDAKQLLPKASAAAMRTKALASAMLLFQYENILGRAERRKKLDTVMEGSVGARGNLISTFVILYIKRMTERAVSNCAEIPGKMQITEEDYLGDARGAQQKLIR
jgi:hypothetical protein